MSWRESTNEPRSFFYRDDIPDGSKLRLFIRSYSPDSFKAYIDLAFEDTQVSFNFNEETARKLIRDLQAALDPGEPSAQPEITSLPIEQLPDEDAW